MSCLNFSIISLRNILKLAYLLLIINEVWDKFVY